MIIVSQDKEEIVNFDEVESIWICSDEEGRFTIEATANTNATLGCYKTKERAKRVLEKIKYWQSQFELFKVVSSEKQEEMQDFFERYNKEFNIYEMPAN